MNDIVIQGVTFTLANNPLYRRNEFESKYRVLYYSPDFNSWCFLYACSNKREFNKKNIKKWFRFY
jgi:hypothetical protein